MYSLSILTITFDVHIQLSYSWLFEREFNFRQFSYFTLFLISSLTLSKLNSQLVFLRNRQPCQKQLHHCALGPPRESPTGNQFGYHQGLALSTPNLAKSISTNAGQPRQLHGSPTPGQHAVLLGQLTFSLDFYWADLRLVGCIIQISITF